ncbi:MAG: hypothetical protein LBT86_04840 [Deltaproteobacteria bacterium]|nr:hypothetical protein [Deltaproteobacteria bacterium]
MDELINALKARKENNSEEYCYKTPDLDRDIVAFEALSTVHKAARLIYLNKTGHNPCLDL